MSEAFYEAMEREDIIQEPVKYRKEHLEDFEKSGLTEETLRKAGYRSESDGWTVPYKDPLTEEEYYRREKLDKPIVKKDEDSKEEKKIRYLTPKGEKPHIYFSKQLDWKKIFKDCQAIVLTEGEKKADKYIQDTGKPAVAVSGVWCWKSEGVIIDDLKTLCEKVKAILIVFDSDYKEKPQVEQAKQELMKAIEDFGSTAVDCSLPGPEKGLDDFLISRGKEKLEKHLIQCMKLKTEQIKYEKEIEKAAKGMLKNPNMIQEIIDDVHFLGVVGEDKNILRIYLSFVSYKLDSCVGFILRGESSSGKTHLVSTIAELMPEGVVQRITGHSAQALNYWTDISHKIIIIGEARPPKDEFWEVDSAWRQVIEDKFIRRKVTKWDPKERVYKLEDITVNGPIVYCCTTTIPNLHPENENRLLVFNTDESPVHVKKVLEHQRKQAKKTPKEVQQENNNRKFIIAKHKKAIELLKPFDVDSIQIPYAEQLYFDNFSNVASRDQKKLLKLIKIVAYLYQYQRSKFIDPISDYIPGQETQQNQGLSDNRMNRTEVYPPVAIVEDYKVVYKSFKDYFDSNAEQIPESLIQKWELAYEEFGVDKTFIATDVMKIWKRKVTQTYKALTDMVEFKMIKVEQDGKGRDTTEYRIIAFNNPGARLTRPEDIVIESTLGMKSQEGVSPHPTDPINRQTLKTVDLETRNQNRQRSDNKELTTKEKEVIVNIDGQQKLVSAKWAYLFQPRKDLEEDDDDNPPPMPEFLQKLSEKNKDNKNIKRRASF